MDVDTGKLSGLKYKLVCHFKLTADMIGDLGDALLKRELVGFDVDRSEFTTIRGPVLIRRLPRAFDLFPQYKSITFFMERKVPKYK